MASRPAPMFAGEVNAAALLDLKPGDFRALVDGGHLPKGRELAPGVTRWDVEELRRIVTGEAISGMDGVSW